MKRLGFHSVISFIYLLTVSVVYSQRSEDQQDPVIYRGRTVVEHVYSPGLEQNLLGTPSTQAVKVYLPPGYDHFPENRYPVVYLLHQYWADYNSYYVSYPGLENTLDQLISGKVIVPMIVVTPNGSNKYLGSFYSNSYVTGRWEDYIVQDVIRGIENKFRVLSRKESRGLAGIEMGGYGTAVIGMKNPSLFHAIGIGNAALDFTETYIDGPVKKDLIKAASINSFRPGDSREIHVCYARAAAFAPDSSAEPVLGRLPYTAEGLLIDSIWQQWLLHDPVTMLRSYKDSLMKLMAIRLFVREYEDNLYQSSRSFHKALWDQGIIHGYEVCSDDVLDRLLRFFSEQLVGVVPTVRIMNDYYVEHTDTLVVKSDMKGKHYIVPSPVHTSIDSIRKYNVITAEAISNGAVNIDISGLTYGQYRVFTASNDAVISNIPAAFCVVPDKSPPVLKLTDDKVLQNDPLKVSISRDGIICLHITPFLGLDTLRSAAEILNSSRCIASADALAGNEIGFSTEGLQPKSYWIYGFDRYGIVTGPVTVIITDSTDAPLGILDDQIEIKIFPNPALDKITVLTNRPGIYDIDITDQNGRLFYSHRLTGSTHLINLSSFQQGVYIITIRSDGSTATRKIIKR